MKIENQTPYSYSLGLDLSLHRMPQRLSRYKKYHIAGTKIYDNIPLGA
jgi:hypothetical protein